jgi:hypothetical protein
MAIDKKPAHANHLGYLTIVRVTIILENTCFVIDNERAVQNNGYSILSV